jgi:phospholipid/cholesterol/gamma-HCH transport system substrate-binding protein
MDQSRSNDMKEIDPKLTSRIEMPRRKFSLEFVVGLFTMLGVGATGYLAIVLGDLKITGSGQYPIVAEFDNISGLKFGATVEIAGVPVGEVSQITLKDSYAEVVLLIDNNVSIYDEDDLAIRTKGIIGDRYVKVNRGSSLNKIIANQKVTRSNTLSVIDIEDLVGKLVQNFTGDDKSESK